MRAAGAGSSAARGHIHSSGKLPYRSLGLLRGAADLRLAVRSLAECVRSLAELREEAARLLRLLEAQELSDQISSTLWDGRVMHCRADDDDTAAG